MVPNPCGLCGLEVKPEDDLVMVGSFASGKSRPILAHQFCAEKEQPPESPARIL